jgi:hypothetical protein
MGGTPLSKSILGLAVAGLVFLVGLTACGGTTGTDPGFSVASSTTGATSIAISDVPPALREVVSALEARGFAVLECRVETAPTDFPSAKVTIVRVFAEAQRAGSRFVFWSFYFRDSSGHDSLEKAGVVGFACEEEFGGVAPLSEEEARKRALEPTRGPAARLRPRAGGERRVARAKPLTGAAGSSPLIVTPSEVQSTRLYVTGGKGHPGPLCAREP